MHVLREDDERPQRDLVPRALDHRGGGLIARRLDPEEARHRPTLLTAAPRSPTPRAVARRRTRRRATAPSLAQAAPARRCPPCRGRRRAASYPAARWKARTA